MSGRSRCRGAAGGGTGDTGDTGDTGGPAGRVVPRRLPEDSGAGSDERDISQASTQGR